MYACMYTYIHIHIYIYIYIFRERYTRVGLSLRTDSVSGQYHSAIGPKVDWQHGLSMLFFFYIFDRWSAVKLTGTMSCLYI